MPNRFRVWVVLSVLSLAACATRSEASPELPPSISPGWQLSGVVRTAGHWQATYSGPGQARVDVTSIANATMGLDRIQNFRASATSVAFYGDRYFTTVEWSGTGTAEATALVKALETALR